MRAHAHKHTHTRTYAIHASARYAVQYNKLDGKKIVTTYGLGHDPLIKAAIKHAGYDWQPVIHVRINAILPGPWIDIAYRCLINDINASGGSNY